MQTTSFITSIHAFIDQHKVLPQGSTIIVGLSGGPDSTFLLHLLADYQQQRKIALIAAHLDHEWRSNSAQDVLFCESLCKKLNVPFTSARASELPQSLQKNGSSEEIGRRMRRYFLQHVRENHNADLIALGHHAQDQQETFFIRLIRGTTLSGLCAMKPKDGVYIRPLLHTNKTDIISYLDEHKIAYLTDPTNVSESFLRNRIRKSVLPSLVACDERFDANFLRTMQNLQQTESFLQEVTQKTFESIATLIGRTWHIDIPALQTARPFMQQRLIMHWLIAQQVPFTPSQAFLEEIKRFLFEGESKEHSMHHAWKIVKNKHQAYIEQL